MADQYPRMESTADGLYVHLSPARVGRTHVLNSWPLVAVDYDDAGTVIGLEICPPPAGISRRAGSFPGRAQTRPK